MKKIFIPLIAILALYGSTYAADCQTLFGADQASCIQTNIDTYRLSATDSAFIDAVLSKMATATQGLQTLIHTIITAVEQGPKVMFDYHTRALFQHLSDLIHKQSLALCLTQKDVIMYGTERCPHCQNQKKLFDTAFAYVHYVDCDLHADQCTIAHIEGYPTRVQGTTMLPGTQNLDTLAQKFACTYK